jgi:hypothetical protein
LITGHTDFPLSKPDFFIASLYNSCAANKGRHFSTPPSPPMYRAFNVFQRAYDAGDTISSRRLPSGLLRAPSMAGSRVSFWKNPALTSRLTRGG